MSQGQALLARVALEGATGLECLSRASWKELDECAVEEGVEGLLYQRLVSQGLAMPDPVRRRWQAAYRESAQRTFAALQELDRALPGLRSEGLEVLVLPGAALLGLYPDPGCRPMDDVDVLVRPGEEGAVGAGLRAQGFAAPERHAALLVRRGLAIDLHVDMLNCSRIGTRRYAGWMDTEEVWKDSTAARVEGVELRIPCIEDMALYTAVHALRHSFSRFTWFVDLHLLLRGALNWDRLRDKAERYGLERPLLYGLRFLDGRVELGAAAREWMQSRTMAPVERWLLERAMAQRPWGEWGDLLWSCNIADPVRRFCFLAETCFPQPAVLLQVFPYLPRPLFPLAYGLRLGQLLWHGSRQMASLVRRS
jgi:hypothetical protein